MYAAREDIIFILPRPQSHATSKRTISAFGVASLLNVPSSLSPSFLQVVTSVCVPRTDFVLGLADLTGEVMRQAINGVGLGNVAGCFDLLDFLVRTYPPSPLNSDV